MYNLKILFIDLNNNLSSKQLSLVSHNKSKFKEKDGKTFPISCSDDKFMKERINGANPFLGAHHHLFRVSFSVLIVLLLIIQFLCDYHKLCHLIRVETSQGESSSDLVILRIINFIKFSFRSGNEHKILAVGILLMSSV